MALTHLHPRGVPNPVIITVPYRHLNAETIGHAVHEHVLKGVQAGERRQEAEIVEKASGRVKRREERDNHLIVDYPVVYLIRVPESLPEGHEPGQSIMYVGETIDVMHRTAQHLDEDPRSREDWKKISDLMSSRGGHGCEYIIGDALFNKSLTLDIENGLMGRLLADRSVKKLINRRKNPQSDYYTHEELGKLFTKIWLGLEKQDPHLFPAEEVIRESALFKASPFHALTVEQRRAERRILSSIRSALRGEAKAGPPTLILVTGLAGTGKTVLLSDLFYRLSTEGGGLLAHLPSQEEPRHPSVFFLINHDEQRTVYNEIATKLSIQKSDGQYVMKPATLIHRMRERGSTTGADRPWRHPPKEHAGRRAPRVLPSADVLLVDEAHLLLTQASQGYSNFYRRNMLYDLLARARVVVAVFDSNQLLQSSQHVPADEFHALFPDGEGRLSQGERGLVSKVQPIALPGFKDCKVRVSHVNLTRQMRIAADRETMDWLNHFAGRVFTRPTAKGCSRTVAEGRIGEIPDDTFGAKNPSEPAVDGAFQGEEAPFESPIGDVESPYDLRVFSSPVDLFREICEKAKEESGGVSGHGISRLIATYDWPYKDPGKKKRNPRDRSGFWTVSMHRVNGQWVKGLPHGDPGFKRGSMSANLSDNIFCLPWNYQLQKRDERNSWAERSRTLLEVGSTYTVQGFDLNYAGLILGLSVGYEGEYPRGRVVFRPEESCDSKAVAKRNGRDDFAQENLRNQLNILLKRGVHGLYLFALDPALQRALREAALPNNKYYSHQRAEDELGNL